MFHVLLQGVCDCGYRHWYKGREVDFVAPVAAGAPTLLAWDVTEDPFEVRKNYLFLFRL